MPSQIRIKRTFGTGLPQVAPVGSGVSHGELVYVYDTNNIGAGGTFRKLYIGDGPAGVSSLPSPVGGQYYMERLPSDLTEEGILIPRKVLSTNDQGVIDRIRVSDGIDVTGLSTFRNDLEVEGDVVVGGAVSFVGISTFTDIQVSGTATVNGSVSVGSNFVAPTAYISVGLATNFAITNLRSQIGIITNAFINVGVITSLVGTAATITTIDANAADIVTATIGSGIVTDIQVSGASTFTGIATFQGDVYVSGDLNVTGDIQYDEVKGRNLDISGVGTIANFNSGLGTITTLHSPSAYINAGVITSITGTAATITTIDANLIDALTANIVAGVVTSLTGTAATITTLDTDLIDALTANIVAGVITSLTAENAVVSGILTGTTFDSETATIDNLSVTGTTTTGQLNVTGISTFQNHVHLGDNDELRIGDSNDLKIFHSGVHSVIRDEGQGSLFVQGDADVRITDVGGNEVYGQFNKNSSVDLYFDNSKKFETTNEGVLVSGGTTTGTLNVSGASTVTGIATFQNDVYIDGDLNVTGDLVYDEVSGRNINITGISTFNLVGGNIATFNSVTADDAFIQQGIVTSLTGTFSTITNMVATAATIDRLDIPVNLDVDGHTELDNVNASGIVTISELAVTNEFDVYDTQAIFHNNVVISGNLSVAGTFANVNQANINVEANNIIMGITTDANNNDISDDITANGGGIAIASTEGSPLVNLTVAGVTTTDILDTYKQIMWFKHNTFGVGTTDAFVTNYAVGVGSTMVPNDVRLATGSHHLYDRKIVTPNIDVTENLDVTGITTALRFQSYSGNSNSFYAGFEAGLTSDANSDYNVGVGFKAAYDLVSSDHNVAVGAFAIFGSSNSNTFGNSAVGSYALQYLTTGDYNVGMGYYANRWVSTGFGNIAVGAFAQSFTTLTGSYNVSLGYQSGYKITSANGNVLLGAFAGDELETGSYNTFTGYSAGGSTNNNQNYNTFIGAYAGFNSDESDFVTGLGYGAGYNAEGDYSTFLGAYAGYAAVDTLNSVYIGYQAGYDSEGQNNIALGYRAMYAHDGAGTQNIAIGYEALYQDGSNSAANIGIGYRALYGETTTTGDYNIALGYEAGDEVTTGSGNLLLGNQAGDSITAGGFNVVLTAGNFSTVDVKDTTGWGQLVIGSGSTAWITGNNSYNVGIGTDDANAKLEVLGGSIIDDLVGTAATITTLDVQNGDILTATIGAGIITDIQVSGASTVTGIGTFLSDLFVGGNLNVAGDITYDEVNGRNLNITGIATIANIELGDATNNTINSKTGALVLDSEIGNNVAINTHTNVVGFLSASDGIYYDAGDFNGPNGIAYFDTTGLLVSSAATTGGITTSNYFVTSDSAGVPVWTNVFDGGSF